MGDGGGALATRERRGVVYLSSLETAFLSSLLFLLAFLFTGVSDPRPSTAGSLSHPFSVSNLPVAWNKPPLPWLLPCRVFPWVSTVAFLSYCIVPCHRDVVVRRRPPPPRRRQQQPRRWLAGWQVGWFVCFGFSPTRCTIFLVLSRSEGVRFIVSPIPACFCRPIRREFEINCTSPAKLAIPPYDSQRFALCRW